MGHSQYISVKWRELEKQFEITANLDVEDLFERIKSGFGIGLDKPIAGLTTLEGDMLQPEEITAPRLIRAGSKFLLLLSAASSQSKIPLKTFEKKPGAVKANGNSNPVPSHTVVFQEIQNLDSFFATTLNEVKPTTRLLMIKVSNRRDLEKFTSEPLKLTEKMSSLRLQQKSTSISREEKQTKNLILQVAVQAILL